MFGTLEKELERKTIRFKEDLMVLSKLESSKEKRVKAVESISLVESLGFINSKVVKQSRELISKNESFTCAIRIASESLLFMKNLIDYFGEVDKVRLQEVKTKKGKTYKAVPVLNSKKEEKTENKKEEETSNELPF